MKNIMILFVSLFITASTFCGNNDDKKQVCDTKLEKNAKTSSGINIPDSIQRHYNYLKNREGFELTFLEFGMTTCVPCKKMEVVMHEIDSMYAKKVKVVFHNVILKPSKFYADHYNVKLVPFQVLLDKEGKEFYQHEGFISSWDLSAIIEEKLNK